MTRAADVARALGGAVKNGAGWLCRCPVPGHGQGRGDRTPSLALSDGKKGLLVRCFAGCDPRDVLQELRTRGLQDRLGDTLTQLRAFDEASTKRTAAHRIWKAAVPPAASLVETYLRSRGLDLPAGCRSIRFAPCLKHPSGSTLPAMIAAVQAADGRFLGLHRTFIRRDGSGKAPVDPSRMSLGPIAGGAVRLAGAADGMLIGEGIETVLAGMHLSGRPGWAALSTSGLRRLVLPDHVKSVTILVDADDPGEMAARAAAGRWVGEGRAVRLAHPPSVCGDFNDALASGGTVQREVLEVRND